MKHTATAFIVALPLGCAAGAVAGGSPSPGVFVSRTPGLTNTSPYASADSFGNVPGTYQASMQNIAGISANLIWRADNSSTFVGTCTGVSTPPANESRGISQTVMQVNLLTQSTFAITYDMSQIVRAGNQISWGLTSLEGIPTYYSGFDGTTADAFGGVSTQTSDTFTGTVSAGTYLLIMLAECSNSGENFSYNATFTAVPAPGAIPAILMAAALRGRRRR